MAKNDFKAFATDRNANVMSQEEWEALPALISGFTAGKASSAQVNKVIRQASFIAAALAQFVSDKTQRDVLDNGDLPGFVELLGSGFAVEYLSRKNPFGDIKSDGTVKTALENLGLGEGAPAIGVPFFWPSAAMPNTVIDSWSSMVFLKFNGAKFSATDYPVLAKVFPALALPDARGDFIRIWDDGRGVDRGRTLLSAQADDFKMHEHKFLGTSGNGSNVVFGTISNAAPLYTNGISQPIGGALPAFQNPGGNETRPRNITFNFLVRAK
ncbi:phage tail protein [Escherichia coli]|uniref:phage tail protein n=1 Tax=Escherichia coli TaxID=562 RepID=UPI000EF91D2C|nr:phage tail protein [Escherichia coli]RLY26267.1 phage tail protein [Escherichia coli]